MESIKIYSYDNGTGLEIPTKIGTFPVDVVLGSTVSELHKSIRDCQLFFVFTHLADTDFIVPTEQDKTMLKQVLAFGKYDKYSISVKPETIWYSDKAKKNIVISDTVDMGASNLSVALSMYLNEIKLKEKHEGKSKIVDVYTVRNSRNGKDILKTPKMDEAIRECDKNPCCIVVNRNDEMVYKSSYGKISVPKPLSAIKKQKNHHNVLTIKVQ